MSERNVNRLPIQLSFEQRQALNNIITLRTIAGKSKGEEKKQFVNFVHQITTLILVIEHIHQEERFSHFQKNTEFEKKPKSKKQLNKHLFALHKIPKFQNNPSGCENCGKQLKFGIGFHTCRICLLTLCKKCTKTIKFNQYFPEGDGLLNSRQYCFSVPVCADCHSGIANEHWAVVNTCMQRLKKLNKCCTMMLHKYTDGRLGVIQSVDAAKESFWNSLREWLYEQKRNFQGSKDPNQKINPWRWILANPMASILFFLGTLITVNGSTIVISGYSAYIFPTQYAKQLSPAKGETTYFHKDMVKSSDFKKVKKQLGLVKGKSAQELYAPVLGQVLDKDMILKDNPSLITKLFQADSQMLDQQNRMTNAHFEDTLQKNERMIEEFILTYNHTSEVINLTPLLIEKTDTEDEEYLMKLLDQHL